MRSSKNLSIRLPTRLSNCDLYLGWISDPYGIPCIAGDRRSNAKEYLGNQSLLTAAGAGIAKLLDADENNTGVVLVGVQELGDAGPGCRE
ncbi:hypothetical protein [Pseudomonas aeruginosa]